MVPAGTLAEPVHTTRVLCPSLTTGACGVTVRRSRGGRDGRARIVITAMFSLEPAEFDATQLLIEIYIIHN